MHFWAGVCMVTVHSFQPFTCIYRGVGEVAVIVEGRAYVQYAFRLCMLRCVVSCAVAPTEL